MILPIRTEQDILRLRASVKTRFESDLVETLVAHRNAWIAPVELIYHTAKDLLDNMKASEIFQPGRVFLWRQEKEPSPTGKEKTPDRGISTESISTTPMPPDQNSGGMKSQSNGREDK